ncbi:hypothetical protein NUSPORA_02901 [Nucleospora cyclopteri]
MYRNDAKAKLWLFICKKYSLESYFVTIFNMIKINTHSKNTHCISVEICFYLCCYHLCTLWNLGKGKIFKLNENYIFYKLITNKNFNKLYKTKHYWLEKAKIIYQKASKRALDKFKISLSSFKTIHLYNILLLIPSENSYSVAFVCYVYHALINSELDLELKDKPRDKHDFIIYKRKIFYKIFQRYIKYKKIANPNLLLYKKNLN